QAAGVELAVLDPAGQTTARDIFSKDARHSPEPPYVVTRRRVGMQTQVHPGLGFLLEIRFVLLRAEIFWSGRFDGQIDAPAPVPDAVDEPPSAAGEHLADFIESQDDVTGLPGRGNVLIPRSAFGLSPGAADRGGRTGGAFGDPRPGRGPAGGASFGSGGR